ncbi:MAG: VTT domain-containing protein [Myxococcota bacterium]
MEGRRWIYLGVGAVALFAVFLTLRRVIGLEFQPDSLRGVVEGLGVWAPIAFVGIVAFRVPLGVPSQVVLIGGGLVFGLVQGTIYGAIGLLVSGLVLFLTSRWAGREAVLSRVPGRLRHLFDIAGSRLGALFIAVGTAYPLGPITTYHLIAGVTRMSVIAFALALAVGSLGRAAIYTYFGSSLVEGEMDQVIWAAGVLLLAGLVPLAFPTPRQWILQMLERPAESEADASPGDGAS